MTALLIKILLHGESPDGQPKVRTRYAVMGSGVGVFVNLLLSALKFILGTLSGSISITADAMNNLSDAGGSLVSLLTSRFAAKHADSDHPFGHGRMEYIGSLLVGVLILVMALELLKSGIEGIITPAAMSVSAVTIVILVISIFMKLWLYVFYRKIGRRINSAPLLAASKDSLGDVCATSAVLLSTALYICFGWKLDGYMGVLVSLFIFKAGFDVCFQTGKQLLGEAPDPELIKSMEKKLLSYDGVLGIHDLVLHDYGPGRCIASVHVEVDSTTDIMVSHEMIDTIEREMQQDMNIPICIHMDPIVTDDETANALRNRVTDFLMAQDQRLTLHDFRIVPGEKNTNVLFDVVLPADYKNEEVLRKRLADFLHVLDKKYTLIIKFDADYAGRIDS
ncbi:MAG: cation diffusion facilitator family transporter [Eubacteriales bacterium]|nr:cation diffusion facilitator family transporter [Eubacteriales bacterium]MDD3881831.1 cation diffusion facilitator family transporter [Eubacteriales bacterium]MDD4512923.1 cation diffusion facilitator family transporter [Eubacteriales bacterium]